ncbi:MAG: SDR family NAD(P)-dependent oxidoreductase [Solirubrobacteraceae bacterium]|nr:SDR family NAD(P)-dependent oxidoreductase [Solirubrobacteraceae bacterium]
MSAPATVLITGAASGIGHALAHEYASTATTLLLLDVHPPERTAAELSGRCTVRIAGADVRDAKAVAAAIELVAEGRPIDRVLHCAGVLAPTAPAREVDPADVQRTIDINLVGSFNVVHGALPHLRAGAHLALVASLGGLIAGYRYLAYSSSKFGVVGLAESLRMELAPEGIRVQVICPGEVATPLIDEELASGDAVQRAVKLLSGKPITAEVAAAGIRRGVEKGRFMVIPTAQARWLWRFSRVAPTPLRLASTDRAVRDALRRAS